MPARLPVVVVDDDDAVRNALKFSLELEGFEVRSYANAAAVLADPELPRHACLVVDLRMPCIDGIELIERLRARGVTTPAVLIVSNIPDRDTRDRARRAGVEILEKPLSDGALVERIRSLLQGEGR